MMRNQLLLALYVGEGEPTNLWTLAVRGHSMPLHALEFHKEVQNVDGMNKIYEGISNIALGLKFIKKN